MTGFVLKVTGSGTAANVRVSVATSANEIYCKELSAVAVVNKTVAVSLSELQLDCWSASPGAYFSGSANAVRLELPSAGFAQTFHLCVELDANVGAN